MLRTYDEMFQILFLLFLVALMVLEFHNPIWTKYIINLDTVQDSLIKLGIKPHMHLWEISNFFTKACYCQTCQTYEQSLKKLGTFLENKVRTLKIKVFKKFHLEKLIS